jgi:hypothetical protein
MLQRKSNEKKQPPEQGRGDEFSKSPYNSILNLILNASCPIFPTALHGIKQMKAYTLIFVTNTLPFEVKDNTKFKTKEPFRPKESQQEHQRYK